MLCTIKLFFNEIYLEGYNMNRFQKGFTIIELVLVIVILAILAAFAIPKFIDLAGTARSLTVQSLQGTVRSAANLVHADSIAQGNTNTNTTDTVEVSGQVIELAYGYPQNGATNIGAVVTDTDGFIFNEGATDTWVKISNNGAQLTNCQVSYVQSTGPNQSPAINIRTDGCGS